MPLPWKKSKVIRISRLVADIRRSPRRGGSLVLQTGFPTSLIDLFVKNRDRFNKSSGKSKRSTPHVPPPSPVDDHDEDRGEVVESVADLTPTSSTTDENEVEKGGKILFLGVLKVFVILCLALAAAQFAWAMAASAFSLLFLEFVVNSRTGVWHLKRRKREDIVASTDSSGIVESEKEETRAVESDKPTTLEDKTDRVLVCETRTEQGQEAKSRSNLIKKFLKRKLRHGKKRQQNLTIDETATEKASEGRRKVEEEEEKEKPRREIAATETGNQRKDKKRKNSGNPILLIVVLCGLIGGRIPALVVTVSWFLILRYFVDDVVVICY